MKIVMQPQNRNLKTTIINDKYVSTMEIWKTLLIGTVQTFETFVWEWNEETKQRGQWLHETYQRTEKEALKVHDQMVENFK